MLLARVRRPLRQEIVGSASASRMLADSEPWTTSSHLRGRICALHWLAQPHGGVAAPRRLRHGGASTARPVACSRGEEAAGHLAALAPACLLHAGERDALRPGCVAWSGCARRRCDTGTGFGTYRWKDIITRRGRRQRGTAQQEGKAREQSHADGEVAIEIGRTDESKKYSLAPSRSARWTKSTTSSSWARA